MSQKNHDRLIQLAEAADVPTSELTEAEKKLFRSLGKGDEVDCTDDPEAQRTIRAELFEWVLTDPYAAKLHHRLGLQLKGAVFPEGFDLANATVKAPLLLFNCKFSRGLLLANANLERLELSACQIDRGGRKIAINADSIRVERSVYLNADFQAEGTVRLIGASIGGDLAMGGAKLTNPDGNALSADGAKIDGNVFLDVEFQAEGEVRLLGASIGGDLAMGEAKLTNPDGNALSADGAKIGGGVFLDAEFQAEGEVRLLGASIGGDLVMGGAKLTNPDGDALSADGAKIDGDVFLNAEFQAEGTVRLLGASIGGVLAMGGAKLTNPDGNALSADRAKIDGNVFLNADFQAEGEVRLPGASIWGGLYFFSGRSDNDTASQAKIKGPINLRNAQVGTLHDWPKQSGVAGSRQDVLRDAPIIALDGFAYDRIGRHSPTNAAFRKRWLYLGKHAGGGFAPQPYTQLAKVLREMGHPKDATKILVERDKRQWLAGDCSRGERDLRQVFGFLFNALLGYGYHPGRAFGPLLLVLCLGWYLFSAGWEAGQFNPASPRVYMAQGAGAEGDDWQRFPPDPKFRYRHLSVESKDPTKRGKLPEYPVFQSFIYSLDTLLPIVDLHQQSFWMPIGGYRIYLWVHIALGWVFTTLLVAGFAGVVRRPLE